MGGAAAVITIYSDKKFETSMAYNSNMSHMSINYDFLTEKDPLKRDQILKNWMKKNKSWMDKEYGQPGFAPEWYGLIIYDNYNKRIVEEQGYTGFLGAEIASLLLVLDEKLVYTGGENDDEDKYYTFYEVNQMEKFLKANKLFLVNRVTKEKELLDSTKTIRHIVKRFVNKNGSLKLPSFATRLKIKHTGWEYVCFDGESGKSYDKPFTAFYEYCKKEYSDFLKRKDHKKWKEYLDTHENENDD